MGTELVVAGSPQVASRAIEECARGQGNVTAIIVPWESNGTTLCMAVTAVKGDGWAVEHTNLGTIQLTEAGQDRTRVTLLPEPPDHPDAQKLAAVFDRFARLIQNRFHAAPAGPEEPRPR